MDINSKSAQIIESIFAIYIINKNAELNICGQSIAVGELYQNKEQAIPGNTMQFCMQFEPGEEAS